jgi:3D (Asp-Asp-Asp) domain-containing protein
MHRIGHWATVVGGMALGASLLLTGPAFAAGGGQGQTLTVEATAYGPSAQDNYPYGATDYFGQPLTTGDVAVDPSVIPLRTCLYITGYHSPNLPPGGFIGEADDEGGAINGYHVDLFMNAPESQVNAFGIQSVKVTILGKAPTTSLSGTAACSAYASEIARANHAQSPNVGTNSAVGAPVSHMVARGTTYRIGGVSHRHWTARRWDRRW